MEPKKSRKADVDAKTGIFFQVGLVVAILAVIVAFQWNFYEGGAVKLTSNLEIPEEEEIADVTKQEKKPPPPPPPPEIQVVEDEIEVEEEAEDIPDQDFDAPPPPLPPADEEESKEEEIFLVVEENPSFPGGDGALMSFIQKNIQYPQMEKENGIEGLVVLTFVVDSKGNIKNIDVLKPATKGLNEEAIRVVKQMPSWQPGKQRGKAVSVKISLPIRFRLQ